MIDSLRSSRAEHLVLVDAGSFTGSQQASFEARSLFLCEMMKQIGYDGMTLGDGEVKLGGDLVRALASDPSLPLVSANLVDLQTGDLLLPPYRVVKKGETRVAISAITVPNPGMADRWAALEIGAKDAKSVLPEVVGRMRAEADVVVLLARHPMDKTKVLMEEIGGGVDVVVIGNPRSIRERTLPENAGAIYATSGNRGQALAVTEIALGERGGPDGMASYEIVLSRDVPEDAGVLELVDTFHRNLNDTLKKAAVAQQLDRRTDQGHSFVGAENCATCHQEEYEAWLETPHASAFATLEEIGMEAFEECYQCHVVGHGSPAGYDPALKDAMALVNVQCEVCHDMGTRHARDGSYGDKLGMLGCTKCHDEENSPNWDPEVYWKMIEH